SLSDHSKQHSIAVTESWHQLTNPRQQGPRGLLARVPVKFMRLRCPSIERFLDFADNLPPPSLAERARMTGDSPLPAWRVATTLCRSVRARRCRRARVATGRLRPGGP